MTKARLVSKFIVTGANVADLYTANVVETANLYYTDERVFSNTQSAGYSTTGKSIAMAVVFGG